MSGDGRAGLDWSRVASRFEAYASAEGAKIREESVAVLRANRERLLDKAFRPIFPLIRRATRIVDVGCGSGDLLLYLRPRTSASLVGFDPSATQVAIARARVGGIEGVEIVPEPDGLAGPFDLVFSCHVIEHVPDVDLDRFARFLENLAGPSGRLVIVTPNGLNPLSYVFNMGFDRTHVRMHSAYTISETFKPLGLDVEEIHREVPQIYDLASFAKTLVWACMAPILKLAVYATAGGVRGLRFPLSMAPSLYYVLGRTPVERAEPPR